MSAPITIIVMPSGAHLASAGSGLTLCGQERGRWPATSVVALEPGADLGAKARDCAKCLEAWGGVR